MERDKDTERRKRGIKREVGMKIIWKVFGK
jgi:hypothetical protein